MKLRHDTAAFTEGRADKPAKINLFQTPLCFVDVHVLRPGQEARVHTHEAEDKCYHVLSGRGVIRCGEDTYEVGEGEIVFCPATARPRRPQRRPPGSPVARVHGPPPPPGVHALEVPCMGACCALAGGGRPLRRPCADYG